MRSMWLAVAGILSMGVVEAAGPGYHVVKEIQIGGEGGWDYVIGDPADHRLYVSHATKIVVADMESGEIVGEIADTPGVHGVALVPKWNHGFTTNRGDSTVTMFDLKTLAPIKKIEVAVGGLDGIMYDESIDRVILTNHSRPVGTAVAINTSIVYSAAKAVDNFVTGNNGSIKAPVTTP